MFATQNAGLKFVDRGDVAAWDAPAGGWITDGEYHELDFSSIIPKNTKLIILRGEAITISANALIQFKTAGNIQNFNSTGFWTQAEALFNLFDLFVSPNNEGKIEYKIDDVVWIQLDFVIGGWFV